MIKVYYSFIVLRPFNKIKKVFLFTYRTFEKLFLKITSYITTNIFHRRFPLVEKRLILYLAPNRRLLRSFDSDVINIGVRKPKKFNLTSGNIRFWAQTCPINPAAKPRHHQVGRKERTRLSEPFHHTIGKSSVSPGRKSYSVVGVHPRDHQQRKPSIP